MNFHERWSNEGLNKSWLIHFVQISRINLATRKQIRLFADYNHTTILNYAILKLTT